MNSSMNPRYKFLEITFEVLPILDDLKSNMK